MRTGGKVDFHLGKAHRKVATRCETCHVVHAARVDASDCVGCHESVRARAAQAREEALARPCRSTH